MATETLQGPSSSTQWAYEATYGTPLFMQVRCTGMNRLVGLLVVDTPLATPVVVQRNQDGSEEIETTLTADTSGNYPIDVTLTLQYVAIYPGGRSGCGTAYVSMAYSTQLLPGTGGGSGGGGGGGGDTENESTAADYNGAITQNDQTFATFSLTAGHVRVKRVSFVATQHLDYMALFYGTNGDPTTFLGSVFLPSANAVQIGGSGSWLYSVECDFPYANDGETSSAFVALSPRSAGKTASASTMTLSYYPEGSS